MSTAHRPTWAPAKGGEEQGGNRMYTQSRMRSALDQTSHTKLKFRQTGQGANADLAARDLRAELAEKERQAAAKAKGIDFEEERKRDLQLLEAAPKAEGAMHALVPKAVDADAESEESSESSRWVCASCGMDGHPAAGHCRTMAWHCFGKHCCGKLRRRNAQVQLATTDCNASFRCAIRT